MHYLFATWDGGGTVPIDFGIARRLLARGHTVTVLADPTLSAEAARSGVEFVAWQKAPHRRSAAREDDVLKDWECRTPIGLFRRISNRLITGPAAAFAEETLQELRRRPADVVVVNAAILGPMVAAEATGLPTVAICPGLYVLPAPGMPPFGMGLKPAAGPLGALRDRVLNAAIRSAWRTGLPALNAARAAYALPALADPWDQLRACTCLLVTTARAFDFPADLPDFAHYVGPMTDDPEWAVAPQEGASVEPEHLSRWTAAQQQRPLVVVGFSGTYVAEQDAVLRRVVTALGTLPVRGLVCTGPTIDPQSIRGSEMVKVVRAVPHSKVFPTAAVVVTHGGHGTITKALMAGKPVLCMPKFRDQKDNAVRMTMRGAGLAIKPSASPPAIARAIRRLLDETRFTEAAGRLGHQMRAEANGETLIRLLEGSAQGPAEAAVSTH